MKSKAHLSRSHFLTTCAAVLVPTQFHGQEAKDAARVEAIFRFAGAPAHCRRQ
jgi:hypothetical protein